MLELFQPTPGFKEETLMLPSSELTYSSKEESVILPYLFQLDRIAIGEVFEQGLEVVYRTFRKLDLQQIEKMLRKIKSKTILIGLSMEGMDGYHAKLPGTERLFDYYLWAEVNGEKAALNKLAEAGLTFERSFNRLSRTGLLVPPSHPSILRPANAIYN